MVYAHDKIIIAMTIYWSRLALCIHGDKVQDEHYRTTEDFLDAIDSELRKRMS